MANTIPMQGFFKHVFSYFDSHNESALSMHPKNTSFKQEVHSSQQPAALNALAGLTPIYDEIGYVSQITTKKEPAQSNGGLMPIYDVNDSYGPFHNIPQPAYPHPPPVSASSLMLPPVHGPLLYQQDAFGNFVPYISSSDYAAVKAQQSHSTAAPVISETRKVTAELMKKAQPNCEQTKTTTKALDDKNEKSEGPDKNDNSIIWDGWPDGDFSQIFDYAAVKATGNLQVHWASKNSGAFAKFSAEHKGFVIHSKLDEVTVISLQTPFMRSQLIKDYILDEPVNGLVSDAAHGWWRDELLCWVPGVFSYSNGASAEHYKYHFLAVFYSMASEASDRQFEIFDRMFAGVVDFSEAERVGFCLAFVEFWLSQPDHNHTEKELQEASEKLLRGCVQHFQAGVTRIKKISGVVPPGLADAFEAQAIGLLTATDCKMDPDVWNSIPDSTNAEEAMHWKLYCAAGRNHELMEEGAPIRYGKAEPWKAIAQQIGCTKPSRAHQPGEKNNKKNDGQPPDTSKELLQNLQNKKATLKTHICGSNIIVPPGFRTHVTVYHLCVIYDEQGMVLLQDEDCYWMSNPYTNKTAEYVTHILGQDGNDSQNEDPAEDRESSDSDDQPGIEKSQEKAWTELPENLKEWLLPGLGVLAQNGKYWYPARLIEYLKNGYLVIQWWRECTFSHTDPSLGQPGQVTTFAEASVVDHLWHDQKWHRQICLGLWTHPAELSTAEDILCNPKAIQYNEEIDSILKPDAEILRLLIIDPESVDISDVPAKDDLIKGSQFNSLVTKAGDLSVTDCGCISNWFETHITLGQVEACPLWMGKLPLAHAFTLIIQDIKYPHEAGLVEQKRYILQSAWRHQCSKAISPWADTDVDKECLESLEECMFEWSKAAGTAGNWQWGMDSGTHQGGWNAYQGTPESWNHGDCSEHDSELEAPRSKRPRPQPRPVPQLGIDTGFEPKKRKMRGSLH
ncbi:hypothetical protein BDQ12DRAFT_668748 [Crucibulum laeve]|uniref:Uncharacterized protein n=1 Tax=Crucibulum laeve TaxID=68775 RepID=A0A5C3LRL8_9AGAR|nr:hypothetical protein BDQ12DRAFT_668748 [Crucibulum laeve]